MVRRRASSSAPPLPRPLPRVLQPLGGHIASHVAHRQALHIILLHYFLHLLLFPFSHVFLLFLLLDRFVFPRILMPPALDYMCVFALYPQVDVVGGLVG